MGTRNKIIPGFPGVNSVHLAMERGEVDCIGGTTWSSHEGDARTEAAHRELAILLQWGTVKDPEISDTMRREIPLILDIAPTISIARRSATSWRAPPSAGRSRRRPACRKIALQRCGAPST